MHESASPPDIELSEPAARRASRSTSALAALAVEVSPSYRALSRARGDDDADADAAPPPRRSHARGCLLCPVQFAVGLVELALVLALLAVVAAPCWAPILALLLFANHGGETAGAAGEEDAHDVSYLAVYGALGLGMSLLVAGLFCAGHFRAGAQAARRERDGDETDDGVNEGEPCAQAARACLVVSAVAGGALAAVGLRDADPAHYAARATYLAVERMYVSALVGNGAWLLLSPTCCWPKRAEG